MSTSLLLIEPHAIVRDALRARLATLPDLVIVGGTGEADEAVAPALSYQPDVVLLEPKHLDILRLVRQLVEVSPHSRIVVYTSYFDHSEMAALRPSILAYLLKSFDFEQLWTWLASPRLSPVSQPTGTIGNWEVGTIH